ncbi:L-fucose:H+ symporter permease [Belliella kenyensis]|uniref:L-fucose:H+ symporter permease n=1 Tax=Belliella kenyensis TaxID=1472724 RepID=A0ABV8EJF8_9BACT|nr:L-fucose:H+ symporter permease [Belliella kenyensis]MCH7401355.1 L-fucose:H+ symporter permease [Belliella kenyensis]MDN3602798.1 L-fucose:H+ symporter permease [Belliella kenyensis]
MTKNSRNALAFVLVTSLFFMWGLANNMTDTLLAAFKRVLSLTDFQTSFVQSAFYGAYFCLALPAAFLIKKYSYKTGILIGLGLFIAGALLFYPASHSMVYGHFLLALFILAGGLSILETAANPYILEIGSPETATKRLNLAQSFNPIGSISGVILSKYFILSKLDLASMEERGSMDIGMLQEIQGRELQAVMGPYVGVALVLVVLWLIIFFSTMPQAKDNDQLYLKSSFSRLIQNKNYLMSVVAQFFYVGAQIGVWSFTIRYVMEELSIMEADASTYYIAALVVFLISRFICTYLMSYIQPARLLQILSVAAMLLLGLAIVGSGYFGVIALISVSACMSLMFPTIFGLGLKGLGEDTKIGGAGLIMAILGGAVLPVFQGQMSDYTGSIKLAFIIPMVCFSVVYYFGRISKAS